MVSVYDLKPAFQRLLRPTTAALARAGVSANAVTIAAALLSVAVGALVAAFPEDRSLLLLLPVALLVRMGLNAIDGLLAREHGMMSRLGAFLDELGDVVSDAALFLPLALVPGFSAPLVVGIVVLAGLTELTGVLGQAVGASRRYDGPMGKSDRALLLGALGLLLGAGVPAGAWLLVVQWGMLLLLVLTIANRCRASLREAAP